MKIMGKKIILVIVVLALTCSVFTIFASAEIKDDKVCCNDCPSWCPICNLMCENGVCQCWLAISGGLLALVVILLLCLIITAAKLHALRREMSNMRVRFKMRVKTPGKVSVFVKNKTQEKDTLQATLSQGETMDIHSFKTKKK